MQAALNTLPSQQAWLHELRKKSMEEFITAGLPTRKQENWKYTDIFNLTNQQFQCAIPERITASQLKEFNLPCYDIILINGEYCKELSALPSMMDVHSLSNEFKLNDYIQSYFMNKRFDKFQQFALLNTALMQNGIFIRIPNNTRLDKSLRILSVWKSKVPQMNHGRYFVFLGENVEINIIEEYQTLESELYFNNIVTQYVLQPNVKLNYIKLQNESEKAYHIANTQFQCASHSQINSLHIGKGSSLTREDVTYELNGEGASCRLRGLYLPRKTQHIDFHTTINHHVARTESAELFKGIIADNGSAVFNGRVFVEKEAQKINANQSNKNILLSETAEVYTKPELEIYANDVKCSHGATIGQLDREALFYLRSRGISLEVAQKFLLEAFMGEVLNEIVDGEIGKYIKGVVKVENKGQFKEENEEDV